MRRVALALAGVAGFAAVGVAQGPTPGAGAAAAVAHPVATVPESERMNWWREARFGMFIHWGLYAIPAGKWGDRTDHAEWIRDTAKIPLEEYDALVGRFNPGAFDAGQWAALAREAGMKYLVITTKHHDGFALFDSAQSEFDVMATPFKRDIMREVADACRREGVVPCWYHSIMDWHHPDYLPRRGWEKRGAEGAELGRYVEYLRGQVTELLTNYGPIGVMWFDGEWEPTWTSQQGKPLYDLCRTLQPNVIVNNRVDKGRGHFGQTRTGFAGDYGTPEQEVPTEGFPGVDWETCMTMNGNWGFNAADSKFKSTRELIHTLCDIASKGGNLLLNVGPDAEGRIPAESVERLHAIGRWMRVNGDAIHGTSATPLEALAWGRCTMRSRGDSTTLYLHVFDWPSDGQLRVEGLTNEIVGAFVLGSPGAKLGVSRDGAGVTIAVPAGAPDADCTVVALEVRGKPMVFSRPRIEGAGLFVGTREVTISAGGPESEVRYTLDGSNPTAESNRYTSPIALDATAIVTARRFVDGKAVSAAAIRKFERVTCAAPAYAGEALPPGLENGLRCEEYAGEWNQLPDFSAIKVVTSEVSATAGLPGSYATERVGRRYTGFIAVPMDGLYEFGLTSDDGARLSVAGSVVVNNDGLHHAEEKRGTLALGAGWHPVQVDWFNRTGKAALSVRMGVAGGELTAVGASALAHAVGP